MQCRLQTEHQNRAAELLDGRSSPGTQRKGVEVKRLKENRACNPVSRVLVGDDPASAVYVRNKMRACEEVGIRSEHHARPASTSSGELADLIESLNRREEVDGILVQLPLPEQIEETGIIEAIDPQKDVDAFHPITVGKLAMGQPTFVPCTPAGIIELLLRSHIPVSGADACVVGRSQIVAADGPRS